MEIRFKGESFSEIKQQMVNFLGMAESQTTDPRQMSLPLEEKDQPKPRGRKPKSTEVEVMKTETPKAGQSPVEEPKKENKPAQKEITPEEISKYMQKVIEKHDVKTARDILTEFKADRISTLPKDKYNEFIERCEKAIA